MATVILLIRNCFTTFQADTLYKINANDSQVYIPLRLTECFCFDNVPIPANI